MAGDGKRDAVLCGVIEAVSPLPNPFPEFGEREQFPLTLAGEGRGEGHTMKIES